MIKRLALSIIFAVVSTATVGADTLKETFDRTYDLPAGSTFTLSNVNGRVRVTSWDQPRVKMHAEKSVRTRNARLTAIHSFFHFAALKAPEQAELITRVLAIPEKRFDTTLISYLTEPEIDALLAAPDRSTWTGRRNHALLLLAIQTGLRASELASLRRQDLQLEDGAYVRCFGKGRKERCTPLTRQTRQALNVWLRERGGHPASPLFPNRSGQHLTRGAIWRLVVKHAATASKQCPSLQTKNITPHTLRHTTAMRLLHAPTPIDIATIALWLGHETLETTNKYIHADMELKQRALDRTTPPNTKPGRYRPPDPLLAFLENL